MKEYFVEEHSIESGGRTLVFIDPVRFLISPDSYKSSIVRVEYHTGDTVFFGDGKVVKVIDSAGKTWE